VRKSSERTGCFKELGMFIHNILITFVIEQEEPYEGRLSRTVEPVPLLRDGNAGVKLPCVTRPVPVEIKDLYLC
jgi:hypothetical protein